MYKDTGFTAVEVMVGLFISAIVALVGVNLMESNFRELSDVRRFSWIDVQRTEISRVLRSQKGWANTVLDPANASLACLRNKLANAVVDCRGSGGPILIVHSEDNQVLLNLTGGRGYTEKGEPCTGFNIAGNDQCPFQWDVRWTPTCIAGVNCPQPDAIIDAALVYAPATGGPKRVINTTNYSMRMLIKVNESRESACTQTLLGSYVSGKCDLKLNKKCDSSDKYIVGFEKDGTPRCKPVNYGTCGSQLMQGIDANGNLICANTCI